MDNNLFDSIDINDLANSENGIVDTGKKSDTAFDNQNQNNNSGKSNQEKDKKEIFDVEAMNLEDIANLGQGEHIKDEPEEDDETDESKKTKTPAKTANATSSSQESALPSLALVLKDAGVFSSLEEEDLKEIKTVEDIVKAVEKQIRTNELADLDDEDKEYLEARRKGLSHTEIMQSKTVVEQYKNLDDTVIEKNEAIQFELIRRNFLIKGFSEDKAKKNAERIMESEDALEEALASKKELAEHEETTFKSKLKEKQDSFAKKLEDEQKAIDSLKSKINENSEILPGIKVNSQTKDKIFKSMTTPVKSKDNKFLNEVMDLYGTDPEYKMKLHALHLLTKGFTDFSKFKTAAKSEAVLQLEKILKETGDTSHGSSKASFNTQGSTGKAMIDALPDFGKRK